MAQSGEDERDTDDSRGGGGASARPARFLGTHHPRLDDKGRLFLPAKFRDRLAGGLVITPGQERCLYVFPEPEFDRIFDRIRQAPVTSKAARDYQRMFMAKASDETVDHALPSSDIQTRPVTCWSSWKSSPTVTNPSP